MAPATIHRPAVRGTRSIALRLPLFIVVLFGALVVGLGWSSYRQLTKELERTAGERLVGASMRLADLLEESVTRVRHETAMAAADPAVVRLLVTGSPADARRARAALPTSSVTGGAPTTRTLWSRNCARVLTTSAESVTSVEECPVASGGLRSIARAQDTGAWVQPFEAQGDTIRYRVIAPVVAATGDTAGYLSDTRTLRSSESGRAIAGLIGRDVSFMLGNEAGPRLWTNLSHRVAGPETRALPGQPVSYRDAADVRQLGVMHGVALTPWSVWLQLPNAQVDEPAVQTLRDWAVSAFICLLLAVAGAFVVSRQVTRPLVDLTAAAGDIARGNYGRRVSSRRTDELGVLVQSFNQMASEVERSSAQLQEQAVELEIHAEQAQELAHELEVSNQELTEALDAATMARRDSNEAQSLLDEVLVQAPIGIAVFDRDMRYVRLNQVVADIHGVPLDAHLGKRPSELVPLLGELTEPLLAKVLSTGQEVLDKRLSAALHNGERRHWIASCFPLRDAQDVVTGVGVILVDTTAQQELEGQFLQSQKMEAVGRLAGGVAHDFNNLLTVITSYSSMALGALRPGDPLHEDIREIQSAADRAARLTKQLLAFSRKQVMRPQLLDLSNMARDMERMLHRLIGEDITLELELEPALGLVSADPGQVEQVLMNLVINARDAMPNGGHLVIETANMAFSSELSMTELGGPAGEYVVLSVTDTGSGMSAETQANLFEPFFTTKGAGRGTGLGLSTVYGIVKQSGGDIHVRSELGRGTTFRIYFPRAVEEALPRRETPSASAPAVRGAKTGSEVILLVEDDAPLRQLAARVLREAGYTVLDTHTPTEAVLTGTHLDRRIDLLLTDVVMPQMSGRTVAELLAKHQPELAVLYMSGYTDDDVVRRGILATETEFLQKPFTPDELLRHVRAVLNTRAGSRAA